jgi:hypothetical protein
MKSIFLVPVVLALTGCSAISEHSRDPVRREIAAITKQELLAAGFEARLEKLGATFKRDPAPEEKTAYVLVAADPSYLPPRAIAVVYRVADDGRVDFRHARMVSVAESPE